MIMANLFFIDVKNEKMAKGLWGKQWALRKVPDGFMARE
jgi:hypothetical protein